MAGWALPRGVASIKNDLYRRTGRTISFCRVVATCQDWYCRGGMRIVVGVDLLRHKLGEPTSYIREPKISCSVQGSSVVEEAGTRDEGTHLMKVGSLSCCGRRLFVWCLRGRGTHRAGAVRRRAPLVTRKFFIDRRFQQSQNIVCTTSHGDVAQLGERGVRNAEAEGSSPFISTMTLKDASIRERLFLWVRGSSAGSVSLMAMGVGDPTVPARDR